VKDLQNHDSQVSEKLITGRAATSWSEFDS